MIKTRPNRGDPVGTYREGKVYLSENFQRYLDEIESTSTAGEQSFGLSPVATNTNNEAMSFTQIVEHISTVEIQLSMQTSHIARLEKKIEELEGNIYAN